MKHALILDDEQANAVRAWRTCKDIRSKHAANVVEFCGDAPLLPLPDEWADVEPATPLPMHVDGHMLRMANGECVGRAVDYDDRTLLRLSYIVAACNERPAMLVRIAELEAKLARVEALRDDLREGLARMSTGYPEASAAHCERDMCIDMLTDALEGD